MLTPQDHANLLAIITSPQLTINASQAEVVVSLAVKLRREIELATTGPIGQGVADKPQE